MLRWGVLVSALSIAVVLAGCDNGPATPTSSPAVPTANGSALAAATSILSFPATVEVAPGTVTPAASEATAGPTASLSDSGLVALFKSAGLPIDDTTIFTADTDPDKLLGKPNQYIAKAGWHDKRLPDPANPEQIHLGDGGSIEIFADPVGSRARMVYLQNLGQNSSSSAEHDYANGRLLLRLSKSLTQSQAEDYKRVLDTIPTP